MDLGRAGPTTRKPDFSGENIKWLLAAWAVWNLLTAISVNIASISRHKIKKIIKFETKSVQTLLAVVSVITEYLTDGRNRHNTLSNVPTAQAVTK
jgi:hypothetical protein